MKIFTQSERLLYRELVDEDEQDMFILDSNPAVHKYLGNSPVKTMDEIRAVIKYVRDQYATNGIGRWATIEKATGNFIGWSGIKLVTDDALNREPHYDLGYRFIQQYWSMGYATEAAITSINYGFEVIGVTEIYGRAQAGNKTSQRVMEKAGMRRYGIGLYDGIEHVLFKITREIWENLKKG